MSKIISQAHVSLVQIVSEGNFSFILTSMAWWSSGVILALDARGQALEVKNFLFQTSHVFENFKFSEKVSVVKFTFRCSYDCSSKWYEARPWMDSNHQPFG